MSVAELKTRINTQTNLMIVEINETKNIENAGRVNQTKMDYQLSTTEGLIRFNGYLLSFYFSILLYLVLFIEVLLIINVGYCYSTFLIILIWHYWL